MKKVWLLFVLWALPTEREWLKSSWVIPAVPAVAHNAFFCNPRDSFFSRGIERNSFDTKKSACNVQPSLCVWVEQGGAGGAECTTLN